MADTDRILKLLDQPTQRSLEASWPDADPEWCWRCTARLAAEGELGLCASCAGDLRAPIDELTALGRVRMSSPDAAGMLIGWVNDQVESVRLVRADGTVITEWRQGNVVDA